MTVDHPDMQRAGIPPTPPGISLGLRVVGVLFIILRMLAHTFFAIRSFWGKDLRYGDNFVSTSTVTLQFNSAFHETEV